MNQPTKTVTLSTGISIEGTLYNQFELREPVLGDMMAAELSCPVENIIGYNAELICQVLVVVRSASGEQFVGPFTGKMLKNLKQADYMALRNAMNALQSLGNGEAKDAQSGSTPSLSSALAPAGR